MMNSSSSEILEVDSLVVAFGALKAVNDLSFEVRSGQILGLIGPNGSGKSTCFDAITGMVPRSGSVTLANTTINSGSAFEARRAGMMRVFQSPRLYDELNVIENVALSTVERARTGIAASLLDRGRMRRSERSRLEHAYAALERVGVGSLATVPAAELTYGQARLVDLARAFNARPRVLLLDEPTAGLTDDESNFVVETLLTAQKASPEMMTVIIDHKRSVIEGLCEHVLALDHGVLVADGTGHSIWEHDEVRRVYLGH